MAFLVVFSYLAARFRYPEVLDGTAQDVLPVASTRGGNDKILEAVMPFALDGELLEHFALMLPGFDIQEEKRRLKRFILLRRHRAFESSGIADRFIGLVFGAFPIGVEGRIELLEDVGRAHLR